MQDDFFLSCKKFPPNYFAGKEGVLYRLDESKSARSFFRRQKPLFQAVGEGEGHLTLKEVDGHRIPLHQPDLPGAEGFVENPVARFKRPGGDCLLEKPPEDAPPGFSAGSSRKLARNREGESPRSFFAG